jgi:hypothetical protein
MKALNVVKFNSASISVSALVRLLITSDMTYNY